LRRNAARLDLRLLRVFPVVVEDEHVVAAVAQLEGWIRHLAVEWQR
jgi:hypothetical protein